MDEHRTLIVLTEEQLEELNRNAAQIAAKEAVRIYEQQRRKAQGQRQDRRLRNTKLLLRNYQMLKEHAENSVFGRTQMEESATDILESMMNMYDDDMVVESIKRSATRTAIMVSHIDTMISLYEIYCERSAAPDIELRRFDVMWDRYLAEPTLSIGEIADKQNISKDTVYADLKIATERMTALLFGVDGLNIQ
ncbi:MAG: hypothetical protein LUD72_14095 [Bacteroidales bacterium]|nr:hypothetical protein [Bacteroidales bacterium]